MALLAGGRSGERRRRRQHAADPPEQGQPRPPGCEILGKAEFMNPGQSVKDRAALFIIRDAVARGAAPRRHHRRGHGRQYRHRAGAGGASMGFKTVIVIPETQSQEKKDMLRLAGASWSRCRRCPTRTPTTTCAIPGGWPSGWPDRAQRRDLGQPVRQRGQPPGPYRDHRPRDLGADRRQGRRLHLRGGLGRHAGRRGAGAAAQGREGRPVRSRGLGLYKLYTGRRRAGAARSPKGSGRGGSPPTSKASPRFHYYKIPDAEALPIVFDLLAEEGLCLGGSSGINVAGAMRMAREMGPGHTIVTILCDYGTRYQSKLFNPEFLREKGLPVPDQARVPRINATAAFTRADGLIQEIDLLLRDRQQQQLLQLDPSPLNPVNWAAALGALRDVWVTVKGQIANRMADNVRRDALADNAPGILALFLLGCLAVLRGRRWTTRLTERLQARATVRGRTAVAFLVSLLQITVPLVGVLLLLSAALASGMVGPQGTGLLEALAGLAVAVYVSLWLAGRLFRDDPEAPFALLRATPGVPPPRAASPCRSA
jgi:cysteine synthase A